MTLGEFIIRLRERLHDIRDADASLIDNPVQDGRRWTAARLLNIINTSLLEGRRLVAIYSNSPILKQLIGNREGVIEYISLSMPQISPDNMYHITNYPANIISIFEIISNGVDRFRYEMPTEFIKFISDKTYLNRKDKIFTVLYDSIANVKRIVLINYDEGSVLTATVLIAKNNYTFDEINEDILITGFEDLMLDIAERTARELEGDYDRAAILDTRIAFKLGININK